MRPFAKLMMPHLGLPLIPSSSQTPPQNTFQTKVGYFTQAKKRKSWLGTYMPPRDY